MVVEFGDRVDRAVNDAVLALAGRLGAAAIPGIVEMVPTFRSLMVHFDPLRLSAAVLRERVTALLAGAALDAGRRRLWRIPVCYEGECAPDLAEVAERTRLSEDEVVRRHAAIRYHVYMLGFLPGFPYLGDLATELQLPRRTDPRVRVPAGAVAIATTLTAIYPLESPGGWHLIGTTPVRLFDLGRSPPALLAPGDAIRFEPVGRTELERIRGAVEAGEYRVPEEEIAS